MFIYYLIQADKIKAGTQKVQAILMSTYEKRFARTRRQKDLRIIYNQTCLEGPLLNEAVVVLKTGWSVN